MDDYGEEEGEEEEEDDFSVNFLELKNRSSWTAILYAAYQGNLKCVYALIEAGANIEAKNSKSDVLTIVLIFIDCRHVSCRQRTHRSVEGS
jgi:ankyrin repeat protein